MSLLDLRLCRSLLFLPASNVRAIAKARGSDADMILLDLEDAVRDEDKGAARDSAIAAVREGFGGRPVAIRMNAAGTPHFGQDVVCVRTAQPDYVVIAKAETAKHVADSSWLTGKPVLAMIETPSAVIEAAAIAPASRGLIAGVNDLSAELRLPPGSGRAGLTYALQRIVLAARAGGVAVFDGVYNHLGDLAGLEAETREGRSFGFDGKTLIHPEQIEIANRVFSPTEAELDAAARLIAAASGGAQRHEGQMIEHMHVVQAQAMIAKARR